MIVFFTLNIFAKEGKLPFSVNLFEPIFEVGILNGRPTDNNSALINKEFSIFSGAERTVKVKNKRDFPQCLKPGQRIAVFLKDLSPKTCILQIAVAASIKKVDSNPPSLSILFNDKLIWSHTIVKSNSLISAVIPANYIDSRENILQIRNSGISQICFDWLCLTEYTPQRPVHLMIENLEEMPYPEKTIFNMSIINLNIKGKGFKQINSSSRIQDFNPAVQILPIAERRKELEKFKTKAKDAISLNKIDKKVFTLFVKRIINCIKMGIEPVVKIKGTPASEEINLITSICNGLVFFWIIESRDENQVKGIENIIRSKISKAQIYVKGFNNLPAVVFNMGGYTYHKEVNTLAFYGGDFRSGDKKKKIRTVDCLPPNFIPNEIIGEWYYNETRLDFDFQRKYIEQIPRDFAEWLWSGGTSIFLKKVTDSRRFFDPVTRKPTLPYYALKRISTFFEGTPQKLNCNVIPLVNNDILTEAYWATVKNNDNMVSILIAALPGINREAKVVCPVPFTGEVNCEIMTGFIPDNEKNKKQFPGVPALKLKTSTINIPATKSTDSLKGIFEKKVFLPEFMLIRLTKKNAITLKCKKISSIPKRRVQFKKGVLQVVKNRPSRDSVRTTIRYTMGKVLCHNHCYKGKTNVNASRGSVGKTNNVVPWSKTSEVIEIQYPEGLDPDNEGASLSIGNGPKKCDMISFWVYPRSQNSIRKIPLRLYFPNQGKNHFFAVDLKPDMWQRVILPLQGIKPPYFEKICIVGDPKSPEYKKGNKITFEFNGFFVVGSEHLKYGKASSVKSRIIDKNNAKTLILSGESEKYFEYRYAFPEPVEFKKVSALSKIKGIELVWLNDAQILEIKGRFPGKEYKVAEKLMKLLTAKEKKDLKAGKSIPIGIKLLYEQ